MRFLPRWRDCLAGFASEHDDSVTKVTVWLAEDLTSEARCLRAAIQPMGIKHLTTVNFGVGGNTRKRLGIHFEVRLLRRLLAEPNTMLILDKGFGPREKLGSQELLRELAADGFVTQETSFGRWDHLTDSTSDPCPYSELRAKTGCWSLF